MNILVTGGAGFIGFNLIKRLLREGHYVESIDNYSTGSDSNEIEGCFYKNTDIENISFYNGKGINVCFHLAALARIQPSFKNPLETYRVNTVGTQKVLEWATNHRVKVIYAGSSSILDSPYQSPYAFSKYTGEELCTMYNTVYGTDVQIARFYNVYGPKEILDGDYAALIGIWRKKISQNKPLTIVGDGEQRRDFTHVDDIVDGLLKIVNYNKKDNNLKLWNLGSGVNYSINEVFAMFKNRFGENIQVQYIPNQPGNYRETLRIDTNVISELNWQPKDRLEDYINSL